MQVIITLAGLGTRFSKEGFAEPKPAVQVGDRPALAYLIRSLADEWSLYFVIGEHFRNSELESIIQKLKPNAKIIYASYSERGPLDTVLAALPFLENDQVLNPQPIIATYCDFALVWDASHFENAVQGYDAAFVTYQGFHPTYFGPNSYCHVLTDSELRLITAIQEKKFFTPALETEITSAGLYYFKSLSFLKECLAQQIQQNLKYKNEFYISLAVQAMMNVKKDLRVLNYPIEHMLQLGTPTDIERFQYWYDFLVLKKSVENFEFRFIESAKRPDQLQAARFAKEKKYWLKIFDFF